MGHVVVAKSPLPPDVEHSVLVCYRSAGLGVFGAIARYVGMPLEKVALVMNSSQVSGSNQLAQAFRITFAEGALAPYRVVGRASFVAWFMQYSVMGFVFQTCDSMLSRVFGVPRVLYGEELMLSAEQREERRLAQQYETRRLAAAGTRVTAKAEKAVDTSDAVTGTSSMAASGLGIAKAMLAPLLAGSIESVVANRAEVQRYFGITQFAKIEAQLNWNALARLCGPAFVANASRNFIMSSTSFVISPLAFAYCFPQEQKSRQSFFWFALGVNVFVGNQVAITQQALWGRACDYAAEGGGRNISYTTVVREAFKREGLSAFYTPAKWFTRVLMNAPAQGTLPFVYNEMLPRGEDAVLNGAVAAYRALGFI